MLLGDLQCKLTGTPKGLKHSPSAQQLALHDTPEAPAALQWACEAADVPSGVQQAPEGPRHSASNQQPAPGDVSEAPAGSHQAQLSGATAAVLLPLIETICYAVLKDLIPSMQHDLQAMPQG